MQPGVHAGVPEALDAQHGLLGRAEHCEWLIMKLALPMKLLGFLGHVDDVMLREHLRPVGLVATRTTQSLATCVAEEHGAFFIPIAVGTRGIFIRGRLYKEAKQGIRGRH